jgi:hypothetical protein
LRAAWSADEPRKGIFGSMLSLDATKFVGILP